MPNLNAEQTRTLLQQFKFKELFIELGWGIHKAKLTVTISGAEFSLDAVAEKCGLVVYHLAAQAGTELPDHPTRRKIEQQVTRSTRENLIIYTDSGNTIQIWQWVRRQPGRPAAAREHYYYKGQSGELLLQKLDALFISLDEEEAINLLEVTQRVRRGFDVERVTKRFYDHFKREKEAFTDFIKGISEQADLEWYASVMLNRLMFVYFIQRKGFLDGDRDYLRNRLSRMQQEQGKNKFYSFYRYFLLRLFHEGLGSQKRSSDLEKLLGKIPYLNGGIFDIHELEKAERYGETIKIPDEAFTRIFDYFDQYQWHLDERPLRADKEINPDVLGHIFEKYVNQKQMGAYYTKEDITEYISKNTVIPFLFDTAKSKCKVAFENPEGPTLWDLLKNDPDRYIYKPVRHGVTWNYDPEDKNQGHPLDKSHKVPHEIAIGIDTSKPDLLERRKHWNKPATLEFALPTEIWREVMARHKRYEEVKAKLAAGKVRDINDLITLNLDIRQFAQDVIEGCEGPDLLRAFWHGIEKITILDPTCGSGAFLFAALNILEPLYEACLVRMEGLLNDEAARIKPDKLKQSRHGYPLLPRGKYEDFTGILDRVADHPNPRYFIFKSIILKNLYGVDIMEEAVEICKLRLFLKLAAQIDPDSKQPNFGIEPLPDIDFNIRAGNTLVGYATADDVRKAFTESSTGQGKLMFGEADEAFRKFEERVEDVDRAFKLFHNIQTQERMDSKDFSSAKQTLREKLHVLNDELNHYLSAEYGINNAPSPSGRGTEGEAFTNWLKSHQPFHWFVEFYGIMNAGGFDVIIGNPPYVEINNIDYLVRGLQTLSCGDLYALCMERSCSLLINYGRMGMIVPVSSASTDGFSKLRDCLQISCSIHWIQNYAERPSKLFNGVEKRLTIWVVKKSNGKGLYLSKYKRWLSEERDTLFSKIQFIINVENNSFAGNSIPKICAPVETKIMKRLLEEIPLEKFFINSSKYVVHYTRKLRYFVQFFNFIPLIKDSEGHILEPSELKKLYLQDSIQQEVLVSILNSSLFFWFFCMLSDVRNVNKREINVFRCSLDKMKPKIVSELRTLSKILMEDFIKNSQMLISDYKNHGVLHIQSFQPRLSKPIIDKIDKVLARHYEFTDEETDFIINYDIKYRMGLSDSEEDEE